MALNVALPLSGLPELLFDRFALLSPIEPDFEDNLELLVTPYESSVSSESGIESNESKNSKSSSEYDETPSVSSVSFASSSPTTPTPEREPVTDELATPSEDIVDVKIGYEGRDILDLAKNLTDKSWKFQYAELPNSNVMMFMQNRSQYHRLGADGLNHEYDMASCGRCSFKYPVMLHDNAKNNAPADKMYKHF